MRADKSLSPFEIRVYRHYRIVHGTRVALAFLLTFLIIRLFTIPESTWPLVTMVVIMGPISFWGNVVPRAFERIGGTVLGSILGLIALQLELISLPLMLVWCAAAMFLCWRAQSAHAFSRHRSAVFVDGFPDVGVRVSSVRMQIDRPDYTRSDFSPVECASG